MTEKRTAKKVEKETDAQFGAQVSFRCEQELKDKVIEAAAVFDQDESWGWRNFTALQLGDNAPDVYKVKLSRMGMRK